jgi:hypothetical protein
MLDVMWAQWSGALSRVLDPAQETSPSGARPGFSEMLGRLPGRLVDLVGVTLLSSGLFGAAIVQKVAPSARALVFSWLLAAALFMVLDAAIGDVLRWYYLGAAPLALLAGRFLGVVSARGGHARLFVALAVLAMVLQMMTFWVTLIFTRYH